MIYVYLAQTQREELTNLSHQAIGRVALRAHLVLLSDRGFTAPQIALISACGQDVVRTWLHRSEREGVAGLEDEPRSGRPPKDPLAGPIVDAQASQSPPCSGHVQTGWTVCLLTAFLAARFHLVLSCSSIRRLRHQTGWRWRRPRLAPARKPDPEAEAKLAALAAAQREARQGRGHLLYLDESDLHLLPVIREGVDERSASARTHARHQPPARVFRRFGCGERALVLRRSGSQVGGALCRLSAPAHGGLPYRSIVSGAGPGAGSYGQSGSSLAEIPPTRHSALAPDICRA